MEPIVLAAGRGSRLGAHTEEVPKLFVEVGGKTILDWQIEALSPLAKDGLLADELTLVLGHGFEELPPKEPTADAKLRQFLSEDSPFEFRIIMLPNWDEVENATSARRAVELLDDDALLLCGDVILAEDALRQIVEAFENEHRNDGASTVSAIEGVQDERTAVRWDEERTITDYGAIEGHQEAGVFVLNENHFEDARRIWDENGDDWFPIVFPELESKVATIDEPRHYEINTDRHLREATENLPFEEH